MYEAVIATDAADGQSGRHPMTEMAKPQIAMINPALGYYWLSRLKRDP